MLFLITEAISGDGNQDAEHVTKGDTTDVSIEAVERRLMQEVFNHVPVIGSDECFDSILRMASASESKSIMTWVEQVSFIMWRPMVPT